MQLLAVDATLAQHARKLARKCALMILAREVRYRLRICQCCGMRRRVPCRETDLSRTAAAAARISQRDIPENLNDIDAPVRPIRCT